ncbi:diaminopimelate decarboxylase [Oceanospirillum sediminis]|uniref:Diaminopimelate decarboxylase n=1 Tax=Oceanospirillum sediminis TaxID=2760088 RepID=A0A839IPU5_9GAMM|nr:diaminopimelate decarboxylase [Oceanospirillum sediminis]MBB1487523.1 diaminopimelate decarboxylase [Oceanospirillum sediminis]
MDHFSYQNGELFVEQTSAQSICDQFGSPAYVYSERTLTENYRTFESAFAGINPLICFSIKSCSNLSVLKHLVSLGSGMDVVSGGELFRALKAGVSTDKIVFAGVGKSHDELRYAIESGVYLFNIESEPELERLAALAEEAGRTVKAAIRINPDISDAGTHAKTSTGGRHTKFGVPLERARVLFCSDLYPFVDITGIHIHLGSPIPSTETYLRAIDRVEALIDEVESQGAKIELLNIGGGYPAAYHTDNTVPQSISSIGEQISERLQRLRNKGKTFIIEPGRSISANSGILLTSVEYVKQGWDREITILNAGMNILLRPTLYNADHVIWPASCQGFNGHWSELISAQTETQCTDIVGPICETGDYFALGRQMPPMQSGDLIAVFSCGAYSMSMASQYNSRVRPAEVMVSGNDCRLIRQRESYEDLISHEYGLM